MPRYASSKKPINTGASAGSQAAARKAAAAALAATMGVKSAPKTPPPPKAPIKLNGVPKSKKAAASALAAKFGPKPPGSAPGVSSSSTPGAITEADKAAVQQYIKMVKMKIPEGAVRQKMSGDGIPKHLQDFVMSGGGPPPKKNKYGLLPHEEEIAAQYRKMIKMKIPEPAVRHKMTADGVADNIITSVLAGEPPKGGGGGAAARPAPRAAPAPPKEKKAGNYSSLSPSEEKRATPYRKMLKMGLPEGAVRQKMMVEGMSDAIVNSVLAGEIPDPDKKYSMLSPQDEGIATQFRKMLKMGLPEGAVRQKMMVESVSDEIQKSVLAREIPDPDAAAAPPPVSSMANALNAIASGGLKAVEIDEDAENAAASSNPGSALAAAAAAASKRRTMSGDALALEIEKKARSTATSSDPTSNLAAAAVAARKSRASGDLIAQQMEARRKEKLAANSSNANFGAMLKKTPRKARSEFTSSTAPGLAKGQGAPVAVPKWKKSLPARSKSDFSKAAPLLPPGPGGLRKHKPPPPRGVYASHSADSADSDMLDEDWGAKKITAPPTIETTSLATDQNAPFGPVKLKKAGNRPPPRNAGGKPVPSIFKKSNPAARPPQQAGSAPRPPAPVGPPVTAPRPAPTQASAAPAGPPVTAPRPPAPVNSNAPAAQRPNSNPAAVPSPSRKPAPAIFRKSQSQPRVSQTNTLAPPLTSGEFSVDGAGTNRSPPRGPAPGVFQKSQSQPRVSATAAASPPMMAAVAAPGVDNTMADLAPAPIPAHNPSAAPAEVPSAVPEYESNPVVEAAVPAPMAPAAAPTVQPPAPVHVAPAAAPTVQPPAPVHVAPAAAPTVQPPAPAPMAPAAAPAVQLPAPAPVAPAPAVGKPLQTLDTNVEYAPPPASKPAPAAMNGGANGAPIATPRVVAPAPPISPNSYENEEENSMVPNSPQEEKAQAAPGGGGGSNKKKKKRVRKQKAEGNKKIRDDGAESHCACVIM